MPTKSPSRPQRFTKFAVLDFEATCWKVARRVQSPQQFEQEIIELPTVVINATTLQVECEFHAYVRPTKQPVLSAYCTELTGIEQATVDAAGPFPHVFQQHLAWCVEHGLDRPSCCWVTCGDWDFKSMLPRQCEHEDLQVPRHFMRWANIKRLFESTGFGKAADMDGMLRLAGLPLVGRHHSGIDDARNIAHLLVSLVRAGCVVDQTSATVTTAPKTKANASKVEKRADPEDGLKYTQVEFTEFYGPNKGAKKWEMAGSKAVGRSCSATACRVCGHTNHLAADCKRKDKEFTPHGQVVLAIRAPGSRGHDKCNPQAWRPRLHLRTK
ncbi:unnamed protein product [Polarella glacialis]|uniref:Exonuclease domain-containing protein n=1 Tax=Polarella glacialis TaxID=89957 RepID=A0A813G953_POLGL|nr:unnamed protein product [Polarella glacialis]